MTERIGNWIQTYSGIPFYPLDPRIEEIDINDIAHSLSMICRYAGHCIQFYSVAEHSVLLSQWVAPELAFWALMHDASEAYLVDVPRPIKSSLSGYMIIESNLQKVIAEKYHLPYDIPSEVMDADYRILNDERNQNMKKSQLDWDTRAEPLGITLKYWSPEQAEAKFLMRFKELTENRG